MTTNGRTPEWRTGRRQHIAVPRRTRRRSRRRVRREVDHPHALSAGSRSTVVQVTGAATTALLGPPTHPRDRPTDRKLHTYLRPNVLVIDLCRTWNYMPTSA